MENFTKDELEFLIDRCFRKQIKLEDANLTDAKCYKLAITSRRKLENLQKAYLQK